MFPIFYDNNFAISVEDGEYFYSIDCDTGDDMWYKKASPIDFETWDGSFEIYNKKRRLYVNNFGDIILTPVEVDTDIYNNRYHCINLTCRCIDVFYINQLELLPKEFRISIESDENNN